MQNVSNEFKSVMNRSIRNRGFMTIYIGAINTDATEDGYLSNGDTFSDGNVFSYNGTKSKYYATYEENFLKADGSMYFVPDVVNQYSAFESKFGFASVYGNPQAQITFSKVYDVKGITIDFGEYHPTRIEIYSDDYSYEYDVPNDGQFSTEDTFGETSTIVVVALGFADNKVRRLRINNIVIGVGITFTNDDIESFSQEDRVNPISEELPSCTMNATVIDSKRRFDIDDDSSFMAYMEDGMKVVSKAGIQLDDGTIEWVNLGELYLSEFSANGNRMTFSAVDIVQKLDTDYTPEKQEEVYERTMYAEALAILDSAEITNHAIDDYLKGIKATFPLNGYTHAEALQIVANACCCIIRQDRNGKLIIKPHEETVFNPNRISVKETSATSRCSNRTTTRGSNGIKYADYTKDFLMADGNLLFPSESSESSDNDYSSFRSSVVSKADGTFTSNPYVTIKFPHSVSFTKIKYEFDGKAPTTATFECYLGSSVVFTKTVQVSTDGVVEIEDSLSYDSIKVTVKNTQPYSRVYLSKLTIGGVTDYSLIKNAMLEEPVGTREPKKKNVKVLMHTWDSSNLDIKTQKSSINNSFNSTGETVVIDNPLVCQANYSSSYNMAQWLGNHYKNNVNYEVTYRGDPRIEATDYLIMQSDVLGDVQVEVVCHTFTFNGAFGGTLELRRAISEEE